MSQSLISLSESYQRLMQLLLEANGELSPELEQELAINQETLAKKADSYDFIMGKLDAEEAYWKGKADQFSRVAKTCANARQRMRDGIKGAMQSMDKIEIVGETTTFRLTPSTPRLILNESELPGSYVTETIIRQPDKDKIKSDLKAGKQIPGAQLELVVALRSSISRKSK